MTVLRELETFFDVVEPQVEAITGEESDTAQFEKLVAIFNKVTSVIQRFAVIEDVL